METKDSQTHLLNVVCRRIQWQSEVGSLTHVQLPRPVQLRPSYACQQVSLQKYARDLWKQPMRREMNTTHLHDKAFKGRDRMAAHDVIRKQQTGHQKHVAIHSRHHAGIQLAVGRFMRR